MDQAAEPITATEPIEPDHLARGSLLRCCGCDERRPLPKRAVRPVLVVMRGVGGHDAFQVGTTNDQQPVEAFAAQAADPALGVRSRLWCPDRRLNHTDTCGTEDLVEVALNLLSRSRIRNRGWPPSSSSCISRLRAC